MRIFYRPHRGGFAESMAERKSFESFKEALLYIHEENSVMESIEDISIKYYGYDDRLGTDTYVVTGRYIEGIMKRSCVLGFMEFGEVEE